MGSMTAFVGKRRESSRLKIMTTRVAIPVSTTYPGHNLGRQRQT
jgi:hypothetical protein